MADLQVIKCKNCDKVLCEVNGEVKKICPKCKTVNHVITTSLGTYYVSEPDMSTKLDKTVFTKIE